jgi:hypothetical protein
MKRMNGKQDSALRYILLALIPYTTPNLKLAYKPNLFFNDLECIDTRKRYSRSHLQNTFYKARSAGLIDTDSGSVRLTGRGEAVLKLYEPEKLAESQLMVIFDIPEALNAKRQAFRRTLKRLGFRQVQRSVWVSEYDYKDYMKTEVMWLGIGEYVEVYEALKIV